MDIRNRTPALIALFQDPALADAVNLDEAEQLYAIVRAIRPTTSAEIGFANGGSGCAILQALADNGHGTHIACDPFQSGPHWQGRGLSAVERLGLGSRLKFHEAFPEIVLPHAPPLQFAFIDASHLFDYTMLDFMMVDKRLEAGGVVGFHDSWMPGVSRALGFILANRAYVPYSLPGRPVIQPPLNRRQRAARVLTHIPGLAQLLDPALIGFSPSAGLTFLQKTAADTRDWRYYARF